jgi:hypothetical protein
MSDFPAVGRKKKQQRKRSMWRLNVQAYITFTAQHLLLEEFLLLSS